MRRRTEREVVAIHLQARGTAAGQAEIAEYLALHSFEDPGDRAMIAVRHAAVRHRTIHALGGEAGADKLLRRAIAVPPEAAALPRGSKIMLAGARLPGARSRFKLPHFHGPRLVVAESHHPVVAIA